MWGLPSCLTPVSGGPWFVTLRERAGCVWAGQQEIAGTCVQAGRHVSAAQQSSLPPAASTPSLLSYLPLLHASPSLPEAGIDEEGLLGEKKRRKVLSVLKETDVAVVVLDAARLARWGAAWAGGA